MRTVINRLKNDESGQAVVEYILVLTVAVGIILGALYQLNDAVRVWANNYFGDYLACLLETGELPALDGSSGGECSQVYQEFSLENGRPLIGEGVGGGGAGSTTEGGENESSASGSASTSYGNGSAFIAQSSRNSSATASNRFRARARTSSSEDEEGSGTNTGGASITDLSGYESGKAIRIPIRRSGSIARGRRTTSQEEEKSKAKIPIIASEKQVQAAPTLMKVERKTASQIEEIEIDEFSFGNIFRYLLIAAIVIAIVFVIGGQILQVSKSMD